MLALSAEGCLLILALVFSIIGLGFSQPTISTTAQTFTANTGQSVYMECRVSGLQVGQTVSWEFVDHSTIISSGNNITVTHPDKYEIAKPATDSGGQSYWNLRIYDLQSTDGGVYICRVDGTDVKVKHILTITDAPPSQPLKPLNETDCCIREGVAACALPLCDMNTAQDKLFNIISSGMDCIDANLFKILSCGGDGRNHKSCCMRAGVTEFCQPLCNYMIEDPEDLQKDYTQCIAQALMVVQCMTEGQANLPSQPTSVSVVSLGSGFFVKWNPPWENANIVTGYKIQYKKKSDTDFITTAPVTGTAITIPDLVVNVVYDVRVMAVSDHGASAPSETVEVATKDAVSKSQRNETIQTCCFKQSVSDQCIDFCHADALQVGMNPDQILPCYGDLDKIFTCLLGADVTPCCNRTQVPDQCLPLCSGKHTAVMFSDIPCMMYLPLISACAIEGAHFIPSAPTNTHIVPGSITTNSAIVQWDPPTDNSAASYRVAWIPEGASESNYTTATVVSGLRHELTGLSESTLYKVLVVSENNFGSSLPEFSLLFITKDKNADVAPQPYNETACCVSKGVSGDCLNICNHTHRTSNDIFDYGLTCFNYLMAMLQCGTDERDHTYCCRESGIPDKCLHLCQLRSTTIITPTPDLIECVMLKDTLSRCFDEGKAIYPKMPTNLAIKKQEVTSITLTWKAPVGGPSVSSYIVEYRMNYLNWTQIPTQETFLPIVQLKPATMYMFRVYSVSGNFTSLPSVILFGYTLNVPVPATNVTVDWTKVWQNRTHCCDNQGLSDVCLKVCKSGEMVPDDCVANVDQIIKCGSDGRNHTSCCQTFPNFPDACLPYCWGQSPSGLAAQFCPPYIWVIMTCFTNGQGLLPTPPQNFHVTDYTNNNISVAWDTPASNCDSGCQYDMVILGEGKDFWMKTQAVNSPENTYTFTDLQPDTKYRVTAIAKNTYGKSLPSTSILVVTRPNPFVDITVTQNPNGLVDKGISVELRCVAVSSTVFVTQVQWMRTNKVLTKDFSYVIPQVDKDDSGTYSCVVTYENGENYTKDLWLNIMYEPVAKDPIEAAVLPGINAKATLKCSFVGFPSVVTWTRGGQAINNPEKYILPPPQPDYKTGLTWSVLQVLDVVQEDYGDYSCVGNNKFGTSVAMVLQLTNMFPTLPPLPTVPPSTSMFNCCKLEGVSNECAELCTFTVDIKLVKEKPQCITFLPQFIFCGADHRDHTKCCTDKGIAELCLPICSGVIPDLSQNPEVANCLGQIEDIMWCAEDGQKFIPTFPQKVMAKIQYDQMFISWSAPKENADKVKSYTIFYQSNEDTKPLESHVGASKTSQSIDGVKKGAIYKIQMVAVNDFGTSIKSNEIKLNITKLTPRKPLNIQADLLSDPVDIRVRWSPPLSTVVVMDYMVYYKPNSPGASYSGVPTTDTSIRLEQLKSDTEYSIYVVAFSQDGQGEPSDTITKQTGKPKLIISSPAPQSQTGGKENTAGLVVGLVLALIMLVAISVISIFLYRRYAAQKLTSNNTVAFENPQYGEQRTGIKISGLPGSSQADNQFGYSTLHEETDTDGRYSGLEHSNTEHNTDEHPHEYDNPLAQKSEEPATLNVGQ